jgi:hypothetical protein
VTEASGGVTLERVRSIAETGGRLDFRRRSHSLGESNGSRARLRVSKQEEACDVCGSTRPCRIKCKVMCRNCGAVLRTCSDLQARDPGLRH